MTYGRVAAAEEYALRGRADALTWKDAVAGAPVVALLCQVCHRPITSIGPDPVDGEAPSAFGGLYPQNADHYGRQWVDSGMDGAAEYRVVLTCQRHGCAGRHRPVRLTMRALAGRYLLGAATADRSVVVSSG